MSILFLMAFWRIIDQADLKDCIFVEKGFFCKAIAALPKTFLQLCFQETINALQYRDWNFPRFLRHNYGNLNLSDRPMIKQIP